MRWLIINKSWGGRLMELHVLQDVIVLVYLEFKTFTVLCVHIRTYVGVLFYVRVCMCMTHFRFVGALTDSSEW